MSIPADQSVIKPTIANKCTIPILISQFLKSVFILVISNTKPEHHRKVDVP